MQKEHRYSLAIKWTGNKGTGTSSYRSYDRSYQVEVENKPRIPGSSDPAFRGDPTRYNPEELLVASVSSCHMLWFLHLSAEAGVIVLDYHDQAIGTMRETADGGGYFSEINLYPAVTVQDQSMVEKTAPLHERAHKLCFIANSVNFPIMHFPTCQSSSKQAI
jgi:organic hydroperoxide reductase OsmC/OhrA